MHLLVVISDWVGRGNGTKGWSLNEIEIVGAANDACLRDVDSRGRRDGLNFSAGDKHVTTARGGKI